MKKYKAYIFDMDLTLLNTLETAKKSYQDGFKAVGLDFDEKTLTHQLSIPLTSTYEEMVNPKGEFKLFFNAFVKKADETFSKDSSFYEDGINLILKLKKQGKIFGIVTNRQSENVEAVLDNEPRLKNVFSSIITCNKVTLLKPNAEPILKCLQELQIEAKDAVYIGDAKNDYLAAKNAGIDFICIERYNNCDFECENIVHSLMDII